MIGSTIKEIQDYYYDTCGPYINVKKSGIVLDGSFTLEELEDIIAAYEKFLKKGAE
jgi:hypothetical protein